MRSRTRQSRPGDTPRSARRRGFTLAEVLVAITFVSMGLFAFVSLQTRLLHSSRKIQARQQPREQAQTVMETWLAQLAYNPKLTSADDGVGVYANEASISTLNRVRVTVTWDDANGKQRLVVESVVGKADNGW